MATVGSVSSSITTKTGVGGLASGMDIDSMILKITAASRLKVTKQEQSLQKLEWKQSAYRSVTKALMEFRDKYFNSLSATNFKSQSLFNTIRATLPTDTTAFTATATSSAVAGKSYVNSIQQLATSETITNKDTASKQLEATSNVNKWSDLISGSSSSTKDFMITLDGVSRTVTFDNQFLSDFTAAVRIGLTSDHTDSNGVVNQTTLDAAVTAFMNNSAPSKDDTTKYLSMAMQINVNRLFENPPTTTNATPSAEDYYNITNPQITVSVNSAGDGIRFTAKDGSRVSLGYATAPATVSLTKNDGESTENYNNRVKQAEEDAHRATGLGVLGFNDKQSNKVDIYSSIADLETQLKGSFVPYGTDTNGNQYVYYDAVYNQTRELTSSNFSFIINDVRFTIDKDESLYSVMSKINSSTAGVTLSYSEVTDKFTLTSKQQGMGENIVMGDTNRNLLAALGLQNTDIQVGTKDKTNSVVTFPVDNNNDLIPVSNDNATTTYGQNAIAYIDGQKIERASNEFTVNGVAYSLKELYANNGWAPQTDNNGNVTNATSGTAVTLAADVTDLKENIKNFVTDYNALVDLLHGMTNEEAYSDYEPLTEEQRAAMSESQIKLWEEKAKSGMLLNDSTVNKILSSMREAFLTTSDGFGLYSMGITYGGWQENGKLKITDEAQLQSALEARPDQVRDFFTNASKGVATKLDTVIDNAVRTTGGEGYRGSLIEIAGWPSTLSETENTLYTQMLNHNKRITALKEQLEKEESRLWTQFSAMEEALSKLNEQNNLITQYFGQKSS